MKTRITFRLAAQLAFIPALGMGCFHADAPSDPAPSDGQNSQASLELGAVELETMNPRRSLIETNQELLAPLGLNHAFEWMTSNQGLFPLPALTHNLFFNLYNGRNKSVFDTTGWPFPHRPCGHPAYQALLNGYPFDCNRPEGDFAVASATSAPEMANWKAIALVNRVDQAPATGEHCGEQRLIMAHENGFGRDFIIFEAQIPNPSATGNACGCAPIAEFWRNLSDIDDVPTRQLELGRAFLFGHPMLEEAGFGPFLSAANLTIGTGQIRTNNFANFELWSLREIKLVEYANMLFPIPFPVTGNLHAPLLQDNSAHPLAASCKQSFLDSIPSLLPDDLNHMALKVAPECWDAESPNNFSQGNYAAQMGAEFEKQVQARLDDLNSDLTPVDIANRAGFAGSCIGCHAETSGPLGHGVNAPATGFVHVEENSLEDCGDGTQCFKLSQVLGEEFLPHRQGVVEQLLTSCSGTKVNIVPLSSAQAFAADDFSSEDGSLDLKALKELDVASQATGVSIGGIPLSRAH